MRATLQQDACSGIALSALTISDITVADYAVDTQTVTDAGDNKGGTNCGDRTFSLLTADRGAITWVTVALSDSTYTITTSPKGSV